MCKQSWFVQIRSVFIGSVELMFDRLRFPHLCFFVNLYGLCLTSACRCYQFIHVGCGVASMRLLAYLCLWMFDFDILVFNSTQRELKKVAHRVADNIHYASLTTRLELW